MKSKLELMAILALVILLAPHGLRAQQTSRVIRFNNVTTTIAPGTLGQPLTIQLWDAATAGTLMYCENQTLDVDASQAIAFNFGAGTAVTPACPSSPPGLNPADFPSGASRFLDVVDGVGASVLAARIPLNATAFALSPGPAGPAGAPGPKGDTGPPGSVNSVTGGDASIAVGGTPANPTVSVAAGGINDSKVANGALSPAKITGTAATLGPNSFNGNQSITGGLIASSGSFGGIFADFVPVTLSGNSDGLNGIGVRGRALNGPEAIGVRGLSLTGRGVWGSSDTWQGVFGFSRLNAGVVAESALFDGMWGVSHSANKSGVFGINDANGFGIFGQTGAAHTFTISGVYGKSTGDGGIGVIGEANIGNSWGVYGKSANGVGVVGEATGTGLAGMFIGKVQVKILEITGGADLSERFEVRGANQVASHAASKTIEPGMVVVIDPQNAGKLSVSSMAYDRRAAGVISGAGGVRPGMLLGQSGTVADGDYPVALAGRVYCWADASHGRIEPGDLLTTSETPGHAMKVTDHKKAQGAIIGKAMTGLKQDKGLVLVLISLQ